MKDILCGDAILRGCDLAKKVHWMGPVERRGNVIERLATFLTFLPKILAFRRRRVKGYLSRSAMIRSYLSSAPVAKLHLGAAGNIFKGWLNTGLRPRSPEIVFLDVTQPFPFGNAVFDYVLSEHLIEHLPHNHGMFMLAECCRVLKPGGRIRLSTPDLKKLAALFFEQGGKAREYVRWIATTFPSDVPVESASMVVNNAFYNWGHRFLYDFSTLKSALEEAGFIDVTPFEMGESNDENLRGVEQHGQHGTAAEMTRFETMVLEASRPADPHG